MSEQLRAVPSGAFEESFVESCVQAEKQAVADAALSLQLALARSIEPGFDPADFTVALSVYLDARDTLKEATERATGFMINQRTGSRATCV